MSSLQPLLLPAVVLLWSAMLRAGYVAGRNRGRPAAGLLWTVLLGPLGLAIILSFRRS